MNRLGWPLIHPCVPVRTDPAHVAAHLADTFVVKETQSVTKDSGVVPVMSSHCAGDIPPAWKHQG